jgi:hypothetical protein
VFNTRDNGPLGLKMAKGSRTKRRNKKIEKRDKPRRRERAREEAKA